MLTGAVGASLPSALLSVFELKEREKRFRNLASALLLLMAADGVVPRERVLETGCKIGGARATAWVVRRQDRRQKTGRRGIVATYLRRWEALLRMMSRLVLL